MAEATTNTKVGKPDTYILGIYITLLVISVVESYSASSREIKTDLMEPMVRQLSYLAIGVVTMIVCSRINYTKYVNYGNVFSLIAIGLMLFAAFFGKNINGAQRAVHLPGFTIQPAELAKVAIVFLLSLVMATNIDHKQGRIKDRGLWISAIIVGMFGCLLVMQGMTNTLLFVLISLSLIIIGKVSGKAFMRAVLLFSVVVAILFGIKSCAEANTLSDPGKAETEQTEQVAKATTPRASTWDARMDRFFERFRTPLYEQEITGKNDQEMYSYMAQAHGGIFGVLPGNSRECSRLPLAFSDYVFSIIVEELGLFGGLFLIGLFFTLLMRAGNIARKCNRAYPAFLVMGMAVMVVLQAYFHMAINTGVFPVSGQPLPLISKGGTSVLVISIAFGVMLSVSRTATQTSADKDVRKEKESLPESMRAANPTRND